MSVKHQQEVLDALPTFCHGTSVEVGLAIQASGFRERCKTPGRREYARRWCLHHYNAGEGSQARPKPQNGRVLQLKVDLGRVYTVKGELKSHLTIH